MDTITIDSQQIKLVLKKLDDAKQSVDDLIDTFHLLQDKELLKELDESLAEADKGETNEFKTIDELRKKLNSA